MAIAKDFPCKICTHAANRHFSSICGEEGICLTCATADRIEPNEHWHAFVGDNLKFMELQKKKQEILDEQT